MVHNQSMDDREALRRWIETWKQAGPVLEEIRRREIREADNAQALTILESAINYAVRSMPPRPSSGFVEMQELLAKLRR